MPSHLKTQICVNYKAINYIKVINNLSTKLSTIPQNTYGFYNKNNSIL